MPWKNGVQATGTGIWSLGMGKNVKNQKWEWDLRIAKWDLEKNELGNGTGPSDLVVISYKTLACFSVTSGLIFFHFIKPGLESIFK